MLSIPRNKCLVISPSHKRRVFVCRGVTLECVALPLFAEVIAKRMAAVQQPLPLAK